MQTGANLSGLATMRLEEMNHSRNQVQKCKMLFVKNRTHVAGNLTCASSKSKNLGNTAPAVELTFGQALCTTEIIGVFNSVTEKQIEKIHLSFNQFNSMR